MLWCLFQGTFLMSRNFFSMTGLCVALFGFAFGGSDAEARHCGRQRPVAVNNRAISATARSVLTLRITTMDRFTSRRTTGTGSRPVAARLSRADLLCSPISRRRCQRPLRHHLLPPRRLRLQQKLPFPPLVTSFHFDGSDFAFPSIGLLR